MAHEFEDYGRLLEFVVGDVWDYTRVYEAMKNIDLVYHAAALKQVPTDGMIDWIRGKCYHLQTAKPGSNEMEIDYLGSALIKRKVIEEVGLYDSRYFAYWEDTDFCTRVKKAGFKVVCALKARLLHKGTYSVKRITGFYEYYFTRNRFWFMKKYASRWQLASFIGWFFLFELWLRSGILLILRRQPGVCLLLYRGVKDGILGRLDETSPMPKEHA